MRPPLEPATVTPGDSGLDRHSWLALLSVLSAGAIGLSFRLADFILPESDEGVYVYAGKLIAEGLIPYRDFMFAHPPLTPYLGALFWCLGGESLMATRYFSIGLTLLGCIPLAMLARKMSWVRGADLLAVVLYLGGMVWTANLGRTLRLEVPMNTFLIAGVACWLVGRGPLSAAASGAFLALAGASKLTAAFAAVLLFAGEGLWPAHGRPDWTRRWIAAASGAIVLGAWLGWCFLQPGFFDWVFEAHTLRPSAPLLERAIALGQAALRWPPLLPGLLVAGAILLRSEESIRRVMALLALGVLFLSVFVFNSFFRHYVAIALPWVSIVTALVAVDWISARPRFRALRRLIFPSAVAFAFALPAGFSLLSFRVSPGHSSGAVGVVEKLREGRGPVLTTVPACALWTGRPLVPTYYIVDNYLPRITGKLSQADFARLVDGADAAVFWIGELEAYPDAKKAIELSFDRVGGTRHWDAWTRRVPRHLERQEFDSVGSAR